MTVVGVADAAFADGARVDGARAEGSLAAALLAVDPRGLGGAVLQTADRDAALGWARALHGALPHRAPWRLLPPGVDADRLVGGADLTATLGGATGAPGVTRGVLAEAHGGVLVVPSAQRATALAISSVAATLDTGEVRVERDTVAATHRARSLVVTWSDDADATVPAALTERLAFHVALGRGRAGGGIETLRGTTSATWGAAPDGAPNAADRHAVIAARRRLRSVALDDDAVEALAAVAHSLGIDDVRALLFAVRAARASAAWHGRDRATGDDVVAAAQLVLAPRARHAPDTAEAPADDSAEPARQPTGAETDPQSAPDRRDAHDPPAEPDSEATERTTPSPLADVVLDAVRAVLPPGLLDGTATASRAARTPGRAGTARAGTTHGRPLGARRGEPRRGRRLDLLATMRAAAPWQRVRAAAERGPNDVPDAPRGRGDDALRVERGDLHVRRTQQRTGTSTLFVVDASGSMAARRLGEAKGAVQLLLAESYVRRDRVALLAFSGRGVTLSLPPTRALARARRQLAALPGGGGTPLAAALDAAAQLALRERSDGWDVRVVLLTDGRANLARDGAPDRTRARADALDAARQLVRLDVPSVVIDTAPRGGPEARELATALRARHVVLPVISARGIDATLRTALPAPAARDSRARAS